MLVVAGTVPRAEAARIAAAKLKGGRLVCRVLIVAVAEAEVSLRACVDDGVGSLGELDREEPALQEEELKTRMDRSKTGSQALISNQDINRDQLDIGKRRACS